LAVVNEAQWQAQVTDFAERRGWGWAHFRPAMTQRGNWVTAVSGPVGKGWPDLSLVRERVVFVECKAERGKLSPEQIEVLGRLNRAGAETHVWRPSDWDTVQEVLR
jgi:hypothetical protein